MHDAMLNLRQVHIALFLPNLGGGGAERVFTNLANAFVEKRNGCRFCSRKS